MFEVSFRNFRGFQLVGFLPIRPITILVGENSAGKSSFLAGLKYLLDFLSGESEPSFNKDPFQLGTFQQISHFRGGKAGRATQFTLRLRAEVSPSPRSDGRPALTQFEVVFNNSESQAAIAEINLTVQGESLNAVVQADRLQLTYLGPNRARFPLDNGARFPRVPRSDFARYWPFLLQDLTYRVRRERDGNQGPLFENDPEQRVAVLSQYAAGLSRLLHGVTTATSAIRTKPQRTYTPGAELRTGEGTHVPYEMAQLYRSRNKDDWKKLKEAIEAYGRRSEMFSEMHIKSFGSTASDPFQIQFSSEGPRTNIVDLGYGTSQVLPLLYEVTTAPKGSRFLIQQPEVHLHPRAQAALGSFFVETYRAQGKQFVLETHSDFIVDRIRNAILENLISADDVSILFFQRHRLDNTVSTIPLGDDGTPISAPPAYREFFLGEQLKLLGVK